ncbi:MAG: ROK family protein [Firmicutes bacterium]|nr:ROK family protein [Bacillota bacterium]
MYINIGRGVGAGLIINGRILQGSSVSAGELGHLVMVKNGEKCNCGARGCLETLASAKAIEKQAQRMVKQAPQSLLFHLAKGVPNRINLEMIAQAAKEQDPLAVSLFVQAAEWIGLAVAGMINILNPDIIMLGGRVVRTAEEIIMTKVRTVAKENALPALFEMVTFVQPKLGPLSGAMGAIAAVKQRLGDAYPGYAVNP